MDYKSNFNGFGWHIRTSVREHPYQLGKNINEGMELQIRTKRGVNIS